MRALPLAVALALCLALPAGAGPKAQKAEEKECPHAYGDFDLITADIEKAATCARGLAIASSCAAGGTSDQRLGGAVVTRCERDFLSKLGKVQKRSYEAEQKRCERRFANRQGTIYLSEAAFCYAGVAERYAKRFAKAAPRK